MYFASGTKFAIKLNDSVLDLIQVVKIEIPNTFHRQQSGNLSWWRLIFQVVLKDKTFQNG